MLKNVIIFTCGMAAGAGAMWLFLKSKMDGEIQKRVEEERMAIRSYYRSKNKIEDDEEEAEGPSDSILQKEEKMVYNKIASSYISQNTKPDLSSLIREKENLEEEDKEGDDAPSDEEIYADRPREDRDTPYSISPEDFSNTCLDYEKESLFYYDEDGVVCDEEGDPVIKPETILGANYADKIGEFEHSVAYIRNESIACDYEVTLRKGSYYYDS